MMTLYYKAHRVNMMTKGGGGVKIARKTSGIINVTLLPFQFQNMLIFHPLAKYRTFERLLVRYQWSFPVVL